MKKIVLFALAALVTAACGKQEAEFGQKSAEPALAALEQDPEPPTENLYFETYFDNASRTFMDRYRGEGFASTFTNNPTLKYDTDGTPYYEWRNSGNLRIKNSYYYDLSSDKLTHYFLAEAVLRGQETSLEAFLMENNNGKLWLFSVSGTGNNLTIQIAGWDESEGDPVATYYTETFTGWGSPVGQKLKYTLDYTRANDLVFSVQTPDGSKRASLTVNPIDTINPFLLEVGTGLYHDFYSASYTVYAE